MSFDVIATFVILALTIALFASDKLRLDVVALLALLALLLTGVIGVDHALAGFSSPVVVMIAALFVIGAALTETGVADWMGRHLGRLAGEGEMRAIAAVMIATASLSAFMSSTGTVAVLLPVVGTLAHRRGLSPSRLFLPLAFGAHLGSGLTIISTPPNLVASDALREATGASFRFFSITPPGLVVLVVGVTFFLLVGRRWLPAAPPGRVGASRAWAPSDFAAEYGIAPSLHTLRIPANSPLAGTMLGDANLRAEHQVNVVGIVSGREVRQVLPRTVFSAGDILRVQGPREAVERMAAAWSLELCPDSGELLLPPGETVAEVVLPRRSRLVGQTLREARFRDRWRATVLAVRRAAGEVAAVGPATPALVDFPLRAGDTLLLKGRHKHLRKLRDEKRDFVLVAEPDARGEGFEEPRKAAAALAITFAMLLVMTFGWLPNVVAVLAAALAMVLAGCVRPVEAYRAINWESVVLIAAMLPMATALERTGATRMLVEVVEQNFLDAAPRAILAMLVVVTSGLGLVISNTATAVLVMPVALRVSQVLELAPEPLLMGVALAASAAFATPISSPVNTIVMGPGGYRFADFLKVGLPLQLLVMTTVVLVVPLLFPF